jgi:ubiquinone/menaquinone biosynthesis C-methylase UbiE
MWPFRKTDPHALAVSMVGVKMGDRLLQLGADDPALFAALAAKVGLTGRAFLIDDDPARTARALAEAGKAGVLIEADTAPLAMLPLDSDSFDVVSLGDRLSSLQPFDRVGCLQEARRVLRPGGRLVIRERAVRGGFGAILQHSTVDYHYRSSGGAETALREEGFRAVRRLAEREGIAFFEAVKSP